ncbi:TIR domain-containing protein [Corallococcus exercitus]|uniref:TIR domain-containing protein n=1 Tax=Corallococcus exercitus TaxID=2316736 RepID=A0A7Y4KDX6_9BACT|nr:TIR domain-containing protein [Corallococcus exercitus]
MPLLRTYKLFISHAWDYNEDYYRLTNFLDTYSHFRWENLSVPEHDPVHTVNELEYELRNRMRPAHLFIILAGMYVPHREWIDFEIHFARRIGRPILGIKPWGSERIPLAVQNAADEIVNWNSHSIVSAIRNLALPR